jgi:acetylornithine deacetylase/succinyl-diaminopimelate desuccinylase-like protein
MASLPPLLLRPDSIRLIVSSITLAGVSAAETNEDRFNVLTAMLRARNLTFAVQPFTLDKPLRREPRTDGRNVIVTMGSGAESIVVGAHYDAVRLPDGTLSRGAVDNAASSVMLVHLAEALRASDLPRTMSRMLRFAHALVRELARSPAKPDH